MICFLKNIFWDLRDETMRSYFIWAALRNMPGNTGMELRARWAYRNFTSAGKNLHIHEGVRFRNFHRISVGNNVEIGVNNFLQAAGGLQLGNDVMLGPGVKIWTTNHRFSDIQKPIIEQGYDYEEVVIADGCWLGANVFVMPGVKISEGCIISAGSLVSKKKYPPFSILAGYPARVMGNRKQQLSPTEIET